MRPITLLYTSKPLPIPNTCGPLPNSCDLIPNTRSHLTQSGQDKQITLLTNLPIRMECFLFCLVAKSKMLASIAPTGTCTSKFSFSKMSRGPKYQGWAPRSFPFGKKNVPFFSVHFSSFWQLTRPQKNVPFFSVL